MEARMKNPAAVLPGAWQAVVELNKASDSGGVPADTMEIVHLRVSQVNGCSACVATAAKSKQSPERLVTVAAWRESPYFTDAERAAQSPHRNLRVTYATAFNDLLSLDQGTIERVPGAGRALSRQLFSRTPALSGILQTGIS